MTRHAIYALPRPGPLADAAAGWLGRDAESGVVVAAPYPDLTRSAARYGFHATIVAPMRLRAGLVLVDMVAELDAFCASRPAVLLDGLTLASLGGFLALVPQGAVEELNALAAAAVRRFAPMRAPLTAAEIARRNPAALTMRQRALLDAFGYPHVLDEFRFHMTLTDRLTPAQEEELRPKIAARIMPHLPRPVLIDSLVLCSEGADGLFHHTHRAALSGAGA